MAKTKLITIVDGSYEQHIDLGVPTNMIGFEFYDSSGNPVTSGLSGTIKIQAKLSKDGPYTDVPEGTIDLAKGLDPLFLVGFPYSLQYTLTSVAGASQVKFSVISSN